MLDTLRSRRFWTFAVLFVAVLVASVGTSSGFRGCLQDHATQAEGFAQFLGKAVLLRDCLGEFIHGNGEAIIAFFTVILALFWGLGLAGCTVQPGYAPARYILAHCLVQSWILLLKRETLGTVPPLWSSVPPAERPWQRWNISGKNASKS